MACHQHFLPRRERLISRTQEPVRFGLQFRDLVGNVDAAAIRKMPQILDLIFEFGDLFFEIQKDSHAECMDL